MPNPYQIATIIAICIALFAFWCLPAWYGGGDRSAGVVILLLLAVAAFLVVGMVLIKAALTP